MTEAKTFLGGDAFAEFIQGRKILIADPSSVTRSSLCNILQDLGTKESQISLVTTYEQALEEIPRFKPHVVITEFDLGKRCGLDLLQTQRETNPEESRNCIFIIVAGNTSQSAVARAAEEDVDAYIVKPYTQDTVRKTLVRAAMTKAKPSEYVLTIEKGKTKVAQKNMDDAEGLFNHAMKLDPAPTLACYYLGQVKEIRKLPDQAKGVYFQGLKFNKIHYKCNLGLYDLYLKEKNYEEAYDVIKRVSHYFPSNPKRLSEVLRLAIINSKYEDVEQYYAAFSNMDDRDESLIKHVCAALIVCGKYYMRAGTPARALPLFQKATATGTGRTKIIKEVVQTLLEYSATKEAREFLDKFPKDTHAGEDYLNSKLQVADSEGGGKEVFDEGRVLIEKGLADERVYAIMIRRAFEASLRPLAQSIVVEAIKRFPAKKDVYEQLLNAPAFAKTSTP